MINKVFDYVKYEYEYAKTTLKKNYSWCTPFQIIDGAQTRAFGAVSFLNHTYPELFSEVEIRWSAWLEKFESLFDEINTQC